MHPPNKAPIYLLYCIYGPTQKDRVQGLTGLWDQTVDIVKSNGLCAAVTPLVDTAPPTQPSELKQYVNVISACHRAHTTIPMRYGSVFPNKPEIRAHLKAQGSIYHDLLHYLTDSEEMGIRLLLPESQRSLSPGKVAEKTTSSGKKTPGSGMDYLTRQKKQYGMTDAFVQGGLDILSEWRKPFSGLYADYCFERPDRTGLQKTPLLSAYFLVRRRNISHFKETFLRITRRRPEKAMLSGPWPPYNFVQKQNNEGMTHESIICRQK